MNFLYYLDQSNVDSGDLTHFWPYLATGSSGDFGTGGYRILSGTSTNRNFSCLFTYGKISSGRCLLMSNINSGLNGFSIGLTDDNSLFIDNFSNSRQETFVFDQITLGRKNTIGIQKLGGTFSIYNYNQPASKAIESQYYNFRVNANNSGTNIYIGDNPYYPDTGYSMPGFTGYIDQLAYLDEAYDSNTLETLFSGFRPENTMTGNSIFERTSSIEDIEYLDGIYISAPDYAFFYDYMTDFNESVYNLTGNNIAYITGGWYGGGWLASGYYGRASSQNPCEVSGTQNPYGYYSASRPTGSFTFSDTVNYSIGESGGVSVVHNIRYVYSQYSASPFTTKHSFYETWGYNTYYSGNTIDSGYYNDFRMQGVISPNAPSLILGTKSGKSPLDFNNEGVLNLVNGYFTTTQGNASGASAAYVNGTSTGISSISNNNIYITSYTPVVGDYLIYDKFSGVSLLHYGLNGYTTGLFYPRASIVYSGLNSWSEFYRVRRSDYKETCSYHLSHGKKIINATGETLYNNSEDYWT